MKRLFATAFLIAVNLALFAQTPEESLRLEDITFVRQSFNRYFYTSSKVMSSINMDGTDLFLENAANLIVSGEAPSTLLQKGNTLVFDGAGATLVRVGAFHPCLCYEASFSGVGKTEAVGISFTENSGEKTISVKYGNGSVSASVCDKEMARKDVGKLKDVSLRVQYTGARFHVFLLRETSDAELLMSVPCDMRAADSPVKWSWGVCADIQKKGSVTLTRAQSLLTCGTGQADPQVFQHKDGSPLVKDGRLWVAFTTRGFEKIPDSYQGVYSLDIDSYDLRLEGALLFGDGDAKIHGYHATKVVYDDDSGKFLVITTTHGGTHTLAWCETSADLLHGIHYLECTELDFPHNFTRGGKTFNTEDPDFFFDAEAGKWRLAYCALRGEDKDSKHLSYVTHLCESDRWNGPYTLLATSKEDNNTGIRIVSVGGKRYVLSGGPDTTFFIYDYPSLEYAGTFRQMYANGGFRGWPTIVPLRYGNYERYLWITFDRGALTGKYSYGTLYFYLADKMWRIE